MFVLFPYFLYRFAASFEASRRPLARVRRDADDRPSCSAPSLLPHIPGEGEPWPWWFVVYAAAFLVHWSLLLFLVSVRLWRAGSHEATVARRRMQDARVRVAGADRLARLSFAAP